MWITLPGFPFSTAMWMVNRIHDHASNMWPFPLPTVPTRLPYTDIFMIHIPNLPNSSHTVTQNSSHLSRLEPNLYIFTITAHNLRESSGTPYELATLTSLELNVMNRGAERHIHQR
jgi:hypothetical protein